MKIELFEKEIQKLDEDFAIVPDERDERCASVTYRGTYVCRVPNHNIYDTINPSYGIEIIDTLVPHPTMDTVIQKLNGFLERMKEPDYRDAFFGTGKYSDENLGINQKK